MRVFSSMQGDEINPVHATSRGPRLLREFLIYAERGHARQHDRAHGGADRVAVRARGLHGTLPARRRQLSRRWAWPATASTSACTTTRVARPLPLGIECDGVAYHSSETARDRDRLRQQVLEARGWTIHRLWSTDWFKDRGGQIERLLELIERTRAAAREEQATEREARERLAALEAEAARQAQEEGSQEAQSGDAAAHAPAQAEPYVFAKTAPLYAGQDFHAAPASFISRAVEDAVQTEAPLHIKDVAARVVALWGYSQVGPAMMRRVRAVFEESSRQGRIRLRGDFAYRADGDEAVVVRSRAGTKIPPERIAPEEYRAAVLLVLRAGDGIERKALTNAARSLFGFGRTGTNLDSCINTAIDELLA